MHRRDVLRRGVAVGSAGGLAALAGCTGGGDGTTTTASSLSVDTFDYREGEDGTLVVTVTVKNSGKTEGTGDLYVTVEAAEPTSDTETGTDDGGTIAARESLEVTVPAGETKTVEVPFEFTVEQFERDGKLDIDLRD